MLNRQVRDGTTYIVLFTNEVHNVVGVVAEDAGGGALDVATELLVHADLLRRHREDHVYRVLFHLRVTFMNIAKEKHKEISNYGSSKILVI